MNRGSLGVYCFHLMLGAVLAGCGGAKSDPTAGAPPPLRVETAGDPNVFRTDHPDQFPLAAAVAHVATPELKVTGTVNPDISRAVPVISLAVGRVVEINARLGDTVKKGQLLLKVQSADISSAFSDYQKAVADEQLVRTQLERATLLYDKGAISQNDLQIAQNAEDKAKVDVANSAEKLHVLGSPTLDRPSGVIEIPPGKFNWGQANLGRAVGLGRQITVFPSSFFNTEWQTKEDFEPFKNVAYQEELNAAYNG